MDTCYTYSLLCNKSFFRDEGRLFWRQEYTYIYIVYLVKKWRQDFTPIYIVCLYIYCMPLHDRNEILPLYIYCVFSWTGKYYTYIYKHFLKKGRAFRYSPRQTFISLHQTLFGSWRVLLKQCLLLYSSATLSSTA